MAKYCENCGAEWEDDALVCGNCGARFRKVRAPKASEALPKTKKLDAERLVKILIILGLAAGILISAWSLVSYLRQQRRGSGAADAAETPYEVESPAPETAPSAKEEIAPLCVVIDPGHQRSGNTELEPIGPGATEMKAKVTGGTTGRFTGIPEYELNLQISLQLKEELENRGYRVVMTRETHDVNLSNQERAQIAADAGADIFVRIHANGSENPASEGAMTICMTEYNPYHPELYAEGFALSESILDCLVESAGCSREYVWETDTMSGINWASMPVSIVEVGYMTNKTEDEKLSTESYQHLIAVGIANGIDQYFQNHRAEGSADDAA